MAKYIKTEDAIPYLTKYIPSVEAVERSKIDKAIEEIKKLPDEYCDNYVNGAIDDVLEILEKLI